MSYFFLFFTEIPIFSYFSEVCFSSFMLCFLKSYQKLKEASEIRESVVSCQGIKDQLPDGELVIADTTRKYLALLKPDKQHFLACVHFLFFVYCFVLFCFCFVFFFWGGG